MLVVTNAFVGGMVGIERTVLPLIAEADFGIASTAAATSFIATFGITKALVNFFAGGLSERWGGAPPAAARLARGDSRSAGADLRAVMVVDSGGQCSARYEPGTHLVDDRRDESRPGDPQNFRLAGLTTRSVAPPAQT